MTAPSASSISNTKITTGAENRVINLKNIFQDAETSSNALIYTVDAPSNPALFNDPPTSLVDGILTLNYSAAVGSSSVTVRAKDGENLTAEATFTVTAIAASPTGENISGGDGEDYLDGLAGDDSISGFNSNDTLIGGTGTDTLVGGTGNDEYSVKEATDVVTENFSEGTDTVKSYITYTLGGNVENLVLETGAGNGIGNTLDNTITGNGSVNGINGGAGSDTMAGGAGNDVYTVDNTGDVINESATPSESDAVQSSIDYTLGANVERLTLTGTAANATGNTADNNITGNDTANTLSGGAGSDAMTGKAGNDTYVVDTVVYTYVDDDGNTISADILNNLNVPLTAAGDNVIEDSPLAGEVDTVQSSVNFTLALDPNVENLTLTGSATKGKGNDLNNDIIGNTVGNTLDGGVGNDTLRGSAGNDTYVIDVVGDQVIETSTSSAEIDTVKSSLLNYTLGVNVEKLELTTGAGAINGKGNELDNDIKGNEANNQLDGASGNDTLDGFAGSDSLLGKSGSDTYIVGAGDTVTETTSDPLDIDTVKSSVDHILDDNFEKLELTGPDAISGTGNELKNTIIGNDSANLINGSGDNDTMTGAKGGDTYIVDTLGDVVAENSTVQGETDTVKSAVNYTLGANVEKLELTGNDTLSGTGNTLNNTLTGNGAANTLSGGIGNDEMKGAGGNDIYVVDATGDEVKEIVGEGTDTVQSSVTEFLDAQVENLTLTGVNAINGTGNNLGNNITGNSAANNINGSTGSDAMTGGTGNDTYVVDTLPVFNADPALNIPGDIVTETSALASETDLVESFVTYTLGANVEQLTLRNGTAAIDGTGNTLSNSITGNAGDNILTGLLGSDTMKGSLGNDKYVVDATGDVVTENFNQGADEVQSSVTYTLGANVEDLALTLKGNTATLADNINATGNDLANTITGNEGNNVLSGGTEIAPGVVDALSGGSGDDTYLLDASSDTITEALDAGNDTVSASKTYSLEVDSDLENLVLTGTAAINGTGNDLDNKLTGNTAANTLNGGVGRDIMTGGTGNDSYFVDTAPSILLGATGDVVIETSTVVTEIDAVTSSVDYTLGANLEKLTLTGASAIKGTGNALNNTLESTALNAANTLDGKAGSDRMTGGGANDTYIVDSVGDFVIETSAPGQGGADKIESSVTFALGVSDTLPGETNGEQVEQLTLTGTADINGTGNELVNIITGNTGKNILSGGAGTDSLIGGAGDDTYIVDATLDVIEEDSDLATEIDNVSSSVTYTLGDNLENLTLTGTDPITAAAIDGTGNDLDNKITGNIKANKLDGGEGKDTMTGGTGNDTYTVDNTADVVTETSALLTEIDTVKSSQNFILGANVENLELTDTTAIIGTGNTLNNTILGNDADNLIDGKAGNDAMTGGLGNDTYTVDATGDVVTETSTVTTEIDTVNSSATYTLDKNGKVENLTLTGTTAINGTGNDIANTITGNAGNNRIDGLGGSDIMTGGAGNDTYVVNVTGENVTDNSTLAGEIDTVESSVSYTLGATNIENLTLKKADEPTPIADRTGLSGTGNGFKNTITGTVFNDTLSGGVGIDTMIGGTGSDSYTVDATADVVTETLVSTLATEADTVNSSAPTYTLSANVEKLILTDSAVSGIGNSLNNTITGNNIANTLSGGTGNDAMTGGAADDTYIVDATGDEVTESPSGGTGDTVKSFVTETLDANVENLILDGISAINGTGNTLANEITGNGAANTLSGSAVDPATGVSLPGTGGDKMTGGLGGDIYVVDADADDVIESSTLATEIDTVQSSIDYTLGANVEKLTLTGTSAIDGTGNGLANTITGNDAANTLSGSAVDPATGVSLPGTGGDAMTGKKGDDIYVVDATLDTVSEISGEGTDTVQSSITYTLGANVEKLTLTGAAAINGTGNAVDNTLTGNSAANTLSGSTGNDKMTGKTGDDIYVVDATGDEVDEITGGAGDDTVQSSVTYTLGTNVEKLTLTGTTAINGTGNELANTIKGNSAANTLSGLGGNDAMEGLAGNDIYVVDAAGDVVTEVAAGGTDTVQSSVTETLDLQVENLTLTGLLGTEAINGTGNALNNTITGNAGNNILSGDNDALPSLTIPTDNDTMIGGLGNDTYTVDATGDVITEAADTFDANGDIIPNTDTVQSSVTETLDANVEKLTLTGLLGTEAINGTGNALNNTIVGNDGINILSGGAGVDNLSGAGGDDTFIVDSTTDTIAGGTGTDLVSSSVSYTLGADLEKLTLTGTGMIDGTGNTGNNTLIGNTAVNTLTGGGGNDSLTGGAGNDQLIGDAGNDKFIYDTNAAFTSSGVGIDVINDFVSGTDKIVLDKTTFVALTSGAGSGFSVSNEFATVTTDTVASTQSALIVLNTENGHLFYNQNGVTAGYGTGAQFATLDGIDTPVAGDFELQA